VRSYDDPAFAEEFTTAPTRDQLLVLVVSGKCDIEARYGAGWQRARYGAGHLGMTAPEQAANLRWQSAIGHSTIQLHLPADTIQRMHEELSGRGQQQFALQSALDVRDPLLAQMLCNLAAAARDGLPDLYAETAGDMLAAHLLTRYAGVVAGRERAVEDVRLRRVDAYMRDHLAEPVSLEDLARQAGVSRFHLLRMFKQQYGETPFQRLTRLRMQHAQSRLCRANAPISEIAASCGYENSGHFATAFRRWSGVTPRTYRQQRRET
jgi:AraC family transcriptional regulator